MRQPQIDGLYQQLVNNIKDDPSILRELKRKVGKIISNAHYAMMNSDQGFCFKFPLPLKVVKIEILKIIQIPEEDIFRAFKADWGADAMRNRMHSDIYYQCLLLLALYGIRQNDEHLKFNSIFIIAMKIWNGRRTRFIKYCDKDVMKYITTYMVTKRHNIGGKYDDPLDLLKRWLVPTVLNTYEPRIQRDPLALKQIFEQSHLRIRQLFIQQTRTNIVTGKPEAQSGLMAMYQKAKREGLTMKNPTIFHGETESSFDEYSTSSSRDEMIDTTTDYIVMNTNPKYPHSFIDQLRKENKVALKVIDKILKGMHNYKYHSLIHSILTIMLSQTNSNNKEDICSNEFMAKFDKNVLRSKNNVNSRALQEHVMELLTNIFNTTLNLDVRKYSINNQIQLRKIIEKGLIYNLRQNVCK